MEGFVLIGRIIAIDQKKTVASTTEPGKTFERRQVYLDCGRYDSITGKPTGRENKPLLEFGGKGLEQLDTLIKGGLIKGDLVAIKFDVQGTPYKSKDGKMKNYTGIRPYAIERYIPKFQQAQQQVQQAQPAPTPAAAPIPAAAPQPTQQTAAPAQPATEPFPQGSDDGLPF